MRNNLLAFTPGDDIRYRGPLSYQWLQALGWFCIVVAAGRVLLKLGIKMDPVIAAEGPRFLAPMATIASLAVPFLMVAVFAQLMAGEVHYKKLLLIYGGLAAGVFLLSYGFFARYVAAPLGFLVKQPEYVMPVLAFTFRLLSASGFLSFNLFIDLFLYALTMYCITADPKRVFTGKRIIILRLLALLPIGYEVLCVLIKLQAARGSLTLPLWVFPLLTAKPPVLFLVLLCLAIHLKRREVRFCRDGRTHEEYQAYLATNRNSLHIGLYLAAALVIGAALDLVLSFIVRGVIASQMESMLVEAVKTEEQVQMVSAWLWRIAKDAGIGQSSNIWILAPFMLLFSYNREVKKERVSLLIPVIAIVVIIVMFLEGFRFGVRDMIGTHQLDLDQLKDWYELALSKMEEFHVDVNDIRSLIVDRQVDPDKAELWSELILNKLDGLQLDLNDVKEWVAPIRDWIWALFG